MTREPYTYTILRYRHDPIAGEQINVGVVLYATNSGFLGAQIRKAYGRIKKVFPDVNGSLLRQDLQRIESAFAKLSKQRETMDLLSHERDALTFSHQILGIDDSSLIWSSMGSGITSDPEATLEQLYFRFVAQYD